MDWVAVEEARHPGIVWHASSGVSAFLIAFSQHAVLQRFAEFPLGV
jgi:hypothetical protein